MYPDDKFRLFIRAQNNLCILHDINLKTYKYKNVILEKKGIQKIFNDHTKTSTAKKMSFLSRNLNIY